LYIIEHRILITVPNGKLALPFLAVFLQPKQRTDCPDTERLTRKIRNALVEDPFGQGCRTWARSPGSWGHCPSWCCLQLIPTRYSATTQTRPQANMYKANEY